MEWLLLLELFLYPRLILFDLFATSRRGLVRLGNCERLILSRLIHLNLIVVRKVSLRNLLLVVQMQSLHLQLLPYWVIKVLLLFCSSLTLRSILRWRRQLIRIESLSEVVLLICLAGDLALLSVLFDHMFQVCIWIRHTMAEECLIALQVLGGWRVVQILLLTVKVLTLSHIYIAR